MLHRLSLLVVSALVSAQAPLQLGGPDRVLKGAWDSDRGRLVLFGADGETWEIVGGQTLHRATVGGPTPRSLATLIYDPARRHTLLFGGRSPDGTRRNDTWAWDGFRWRQLPSAVAPSARELAGAAYDSARQRVVLFGGLSSQETDTWEHDGTSWQRHATATAPPAANPAMTYDAHRGLTVLVTYGGFGGSPAETWEWNGSAWRRRTPTGSWPSQRQQPGLVYDPIRRVSVLFGGNEDPGQVWEWNGFAWRLARTVGEPQRQSPIGWWDPQRGAIAMHGGNMHFPNGSGPQRSDLWTWDGQTMTQVHGDLRPSSRFGHALTADQTTGTALMFGGFQNVGNPLDTWLWNGNAWRQQNPAVSPSARMDAGLAFDFGTRRFLMFGGFAAGTVLNDLWSFDGITWQSINTPAPPPPRGSMGIAFDITRNTLVVFGGSGTNGVMGNDTWEWNGTSWRGVFPPTRPSPRIDVAMDFDLVRGRVVLFGGRIGFTAQDQLADTWEYDGTLWRQIQPVQSPPNLLMPSLAYDLTQGVCRMVGHRFVTQGQFDLEQWRYDGTTWTRTHVDPGSRIGSVKVAPSVIGGRMAMYDGLNLVEWPTGPAATNTHYGVGCGTPIPELTTRTRARMGNAEFGLESLLRPGEIAVFGLGFAQGNLALGNGCTQWLAQLDASLLGIAAPGGLAEQRLPLPTSALWFGASLFAQGFAIDPGTAALRVTAGLQFQIGN